MNIREAATYYVKLHKPEKIDVDFITSTFGSVENYLDQEGANNDLGERYVEISQHDSIDGATKTVEWYEDSYQIAFYTKPESDRSSPEDFTPEIYFEPDFDVAIDGAVSLVKNDLSHISWASSRHAYDVSVTKYKDGAAVEDIDVSESLP